MSKPQRDPIQELLQALGREKDAAGRARLLEAAAQRHPTDARIYLLIAGERMSERNVDGAEAAYIAALSLAPEFHIARFQLGLLQLTSGRPAAATATWALLDVLDEKAPLRLFKEGLLLMIQDRFDEAKTRLREGIERNKENLPLNKDMQMVIERIDRMAPPADKDDPEASAQGREHFLVSAYRSSN